MNVMKERTLSRRDAAGLIAFCIAGIVIAATITIFSVIRIIELARGVDVPVQVEFIGSATEVTIPLASGRSIPAGLDTATITAPELPAIATVPGIIGQVVQILTILVVIGCLILLARSVLSGRVFSRRNTALVATAGLTGLVGFAAIRFFENMLANATVASVADNGVATALISAQPFPFILAAFAVALVNTVFVVGDRLQRDTEGLV